MYGCEGTYVTIVGRFEMEICFLIENTCCIETKKLQPKGCTPGLMIFVGHVWLQSDPRENLLF